MLTKSDTKAVVLVILIATLLAIGTGLLLTHVLAPIISAGIVVGGV